jgi:hypothetical protein
MPGGASIAYAASTKENGSRSVHLGTVFTVLANAIKKSCRFHEKKIGTGSVA